MFRSIALTLLSLPLVASCTTTEIVEDDLAGELPTPGADLEHAHAVERAQEVEQRPAHRRVDQVVLAEALLEPPPARR